MSNKARNTSGKFAAKSETPRKIRSVNLTDDTWQWLAEVAAQAGVSRNDYLEAMAEGKVPLMETVEADAQNLTQQPDSELPPLMETAEVEDAKAEYNALLESSTHITNKLRQELAEVRSQLATERADREEVERQLSDRETEIAELRSQLETVQENPEIEFDFVGKAGELKNWLGKILGKGLPKQVTVKEIRKILEGTIIEES